MIVAIGDIHGRHQALNRLLDAVLDRLQESDAIVFLGDYIDRGTGSAQVLERIVCLETRASIVTLRGNHEELALEAKEGFQPLFDNNGVYLSENDPARLWLAQGGSETLASYGLDLVGASDEEYVSWPSFIPEAHWQFMNKTVCEFRTDAFLFVHAGVLPPGQTVWEYDAFGADPRLWIREPFLSFEGSFGGVKIVFGHSPQESGLPLVTEHKIGLDTGAAQGGPLTAALLHEDGRLLEIIQADDESVSKL